MGFNPWLGLVVVLLSYDLLGPLLSSLSGSNEESDEVNPATHSQTQHDVVKDLLQKSLDGRMYVAFCTS